MASRWIGFVGGALLAWMGEIGAVQAQEAAFASVDSLLQALVDEERIAGAVVQVARGGEVVHRQAFGYAQRYIYGRVPLGTPEAMTTEHLFDLASLTKVFATTFAAMLLVDEGRIDLDAPLNRYLPAFAGGGKDSVTVRHLLTHTAGLAEWEPIYYHAQTDSAALTYVAHLPLRYEVGAARHYSDLGFMLLGALAQATTGQRLDAYLHDRLYAPLGLRHTVFTPLQHGFHPRQIAATSHGNPFERRMVYDDDFGYVCDEDPEAWDGWRAYTLRGEVNDGNAFHAWGGVAGHAGLFSTADDLQRLIDLLLAGGQHEGNPLLDAEVIAAFLQEDAFGNALGWAKDPTIIQARGAPKGAFGHTGFTGTSVVVVPEHALSILLLTNRQNVGVGADGRYYNLNPARQQLTTLVLEELGL